MTNGPTQYVLGIDFGTLSARAVLVEALSGEIVGVGEHAYRHAVLEETLPAGLAGGDSSHAGAPVELDALWALQVPADYLESLELSIVGAVKAAGVQATQVAGLSIDFTACTVLPVRDDGTPLCETEEFRANPHSYVKLWKHHAAQGQADRINALATEQGLDWLARYGGKLSSEWQLAKGLQIFEDAPEIYQAMDHLVEATDWVTWMMTGNFVRNEALAGYKGARQESGYPSSEFLEGLAPGFGEFCETKLNGTFAQIGQLAGSLEPAMAKRLGLQEGTPVAVGNVDAHVAAPVAGSLSSGQFLAVMGTSTCHILNSDELRLVEGMCGVVKNGAVPGLWGYEAGQSGVGDIFGWFVDQAVPGHVEADAKAAGVSVHELLTERASKLAIGEHGLVALDWWSGNRSTLVDHELSGLLLGLTLGTEAHHIYRALLEATVFGTRTIVDSFEDAGVPVTEIFVAGGLSKNALLMQLTADIVGRPVSLVESTQGPALGSAMQAAVVAGFYPDIVAASNTMSRVNRSAYVPNADATARYDEIFAEYSELVDNFGRDGGKAMKRLLAIRRRARTVSGERNETTS